jgi:hypothetical protein
LEVQWEKKIQVFYLFQYFVTWIIIIFLNYYLDYAACMLCITWNSMVCRWLVKNTISVHTQVWLQRKFVDWIHQFQTQNWCCH